LQGKSVFGVNLGDNWNRVNSRDLIGFLGGLIRQIRGLIIRIFDGQLWTSLKKIQNHGPNCKKHVIVGARIDQINGQIEKNKKFDDELRVQVDKSETMDSDKNDTKLWGWWLSLAKEKLHEIKSLRGNYECN